MQLDMLYHAIWIEWIEDFLVSENWSEVLTLEAPSTHPLSIMLIRQASFREVRPNPS